MDTLREVEKRAPRDQFYSDADAAAARNALPLLLDVVDAARAVSDSTEATAEHGEALWALRDALAALDTEPLP